MTNIKIINSILWQQYLIGGIFSSFGAGSSALVHNHVALPAERSPSASFSDITGSRVRRRWTGNVSLQAAVAAHASPCPHWTLNSSTPLRRHHFMFRGSPCVCVYMLRMSLVSFVLNSDENNSDYCYFHLHSHLFLGLSHTDTLQLSLYFTRSCVFSQHHVSFRTQPSLSPQRAPSNGRACTSDPSVAPGLPDFCGS